MSNKEIERTASGRLRKRGARPPLISKTLGGALRLGWHRTGELDSAAGPSPWYLRGDLAPTIPGFEWHDDTSSQIGHIALVGESGPVALFGFYNWVQLLEDGGLLVWHQATRRDESQSAPVSFALFDPAMLTPLDLESARDRIEAGEPYVVGGDPNLAFMLPTNVVGVPQPAQIPLPLDELLLWCHSSGAGELSGVPGGDTALMVVEPRSDSYALHAQDWFNKPSTDFGYQWLTRVARQRLTGRVTGDGIRVDRFVLDKSLRRRSR